MKIDKIKVNNLTHFFVNDYGDRTPALDNVTLDFPINQITAIIGSAGSGKTTLLKHLNALLLPLTGSIEIGDLTIYPNQSQITQIQMIRKNIGFIFEFPERQLFKDTVEKDILFGPLNFGFSKTVAKKNAIKYLKLLSLDLSYLRRSPFDLSGGQKRKAAIAGILAYDPQVILFDQLGSGLDLKAKKNFLNFLVNLKQQMQKTIIFTSNNTDDVLQIADRVIILEQGKVVRVTSPQTLFQDLVFCRKYKIILPQTISFLSQLQKKGFILP